MDLKVIGFVLLLAIIIVIIYNNYIDTVQKKKYIVELKPPKYTFVKNMKGIIPCISRNVRLAARGIMKVIPVDESRTRIIFTFAGLLPNSVYSFWNVKKMVPFVSEPLLKRGFNGIITDRDGKAFTDIKVNKPLGIKFMLNLHVDDDVSSNRKGKEVFPAILEGAFSKLA